MKVKELKQKIEEAIQNNESERFSGDLTFEDIKSITDSKYGNPFFRLCQEIVYSDFLFDGIKIEGVREERFGDEFDCYEWVYKYGDDYFRWTGWYESHNGAEMDSGPFDCKPVEIITTVYEDI